MSITQPIQAAFYTATSFYDARIAAGGTTTAISAGTNVNGVIICGGSILAWNDSGGFRTAHNSVGIPCLKIQAGVAIDFEFTNALCASGSAYMLALFLRANSQRLLACGQSTTNADFNANAGQAVPNYYQVTFGYKLL